MKLKKLISSSLAIGLLFNSTSSSLASILSEDGRYETFEGNNITIDNILEEDKVDVEIEGNTIVNVANQKDPVPITKAYTVENTNHIPLQGECDGKARPVIEGNTMYYNNDTGELTDTFVEGANLSLVSSFEDQLVTQEMVDSCLEKAENLGKYKVEIKTTGKNKLNPEWLPDILKTNSTKHGVSIKIEDNKIIQSGVATETYTELGINIIDYLIDGVKYVRENRISLGLQIVNHDNTFTYPLNEPFTVDKSTMKEIRLYYQIEKDKNYSYEHKIPQLEEGSIITEYEPYKESIKTFYLNSPLLEGDTIEYINGQATHIKRCGEIILNGSERLIENSFAITRENTVTRCISVPDGKLSSPINSSFNRDKKSVNQDIEGIVHDGYGLLYIAIDKSRLQTFDTNSVKLWLQNNPTRVVYNLLNPVYETISEESILCDSYINGHLDLNTNIPVNKVDFIPTTTNLNYLYPSTEYTVQFESDNKGKVGRVSLGNEVLYSNYTVNKGINRFNIITPSEISYTELIFDGIGFNLSNLVVTEATDENFDYFEGIKSVGQDDISGHNIEVISNNSDKTQSNKVEILLSEPLRSLPNGAKDRIIKRNGQWVVERNCKEYILDGSEDYWIESSNHSDVTLRFVAFHICEDTIPTSQVYSNNFPYLGIRGSSDEECVFMYGKRIQIFIKKEKVATLTEFKSWLSNNPVSVIYQLSNPIYEPLHINSTINTYLETTYISNSSNIPASMKVVIDRAMNRVVEAIEVAKNNPTVSNISNARYWTNLLKESIKKDELQGEINSITNIEDFQLEKKTATGNVDMYIKSENALSISLSNNSVTFNNYSGIEDIVIDNAVNISISSSLPYQLNSYLLTEIENSDKSSRIEKDLLNIKSSSDIDYKVFNDINDKLVLEDSCDAGNNKLHSVDLKLKGSQAHKADIYKAVIKFEAEQK